MSARLNTLRRTERALKAKEASALLSVNEQAPLVALAFKGKKKALGVMFVTKHERREEPEVNTVMLSRDTTRGPLDSIDTSVYTALVVAGVGNRAELGMITDFAEYAIHDLAGDGGVHARTNEDLAKALRNELNTTLRDVYCEAPYRVEFVLVSLLGNEFFMARFKYDGSFDRVNPYCIVGGNLPVAKKPAGHKGKELPSVRHVALDLMKQAYRNGLPDKETAEKLAKRILSLRNFPGIYIAEEIGWTDES